VKYIAALDGIRGIAILLVLTTNLEWGFPRGGYLGVDVFFVLSGFLITALLLDEFKKNGRIDLKYFWARRALRLLPALVAVIACLLGYAVILGSAAIRHDVITGSGYTLFYVGNWYMALGGAPAFGTMGALSHTWSLSVEEQFYLVWPAALVVILASSPSLRRLGLGLLFGALIVAAWRSWLWFGGAHWTRLYFGTDVRADGLLVGSALGVAFTLGLVERLEKRTATILGAIGVLVFAWLVLSFGHNDPFMYAGGGYTFAGLATAAAMLHVLRSPEALPARLLSSKALVALGRVSYGMYLWHFPIAALIDVPADATIPVRLLYEIVRVLVTVAVTIGSYYLIERPFLRLKGRFRARRSRPVVVRDSIA